MLYISGINYESIADAEGVACTIFFSGCEHKCKGCHSKDTWNFKNGQELNIDLINIINDEIKKRPFLNALVLSGGDPLYSINDIIDLLPKLIIPKNNIWCYTGFTMEEIQENENMKKILNYINVLIDGPFILEQRDITLKFRGSKNQRIWKKENNIWKIEDN